MLAASPFSETDRLADHGRLGCGCLLQKRRMRALSWVVQASWVAHGSELPDGRTLGASRALVSVVLSVVRHVIRRIVGRSSLRVLLWTVRHSVVHALPWCCILSDGSAGKRGRDQLNSTRRTSAIRSIMSSAASGRNGVRSAACHQ